MKSILVTAPTTQVLTLTQAVEHCHTEEGLEDASINLYIRAAQSLIENVLGRALTSQVRRLPLDSFPSGSNPIKLPYPPLISVDELAYTDSNGDSQTLTTHVTNSDAEPALIYPPSTGWPTTDPDAHPAVTVTYTCGHSDSRPLDAMIEHFVYLFVGLSYLAREPVEIGTIITQYPHVWQCLLGHPYRDTTDYSDQ